MNQTSAPDMIAFAITPARRSSTIQPVIPIYDSTTVVF
jgi:hypothetical protein